MRGLRRDCPERGAERASRVGVALRQPPREEAGRAGRRAPEGPAPSLRRRRRDAGGSPRPARRSPPPSSPAARAVPWGCRRQRRDDLRFGRQPGHPRRRHRRRHHHVEPPDVLRAADRPRAARYGHHGLHRHDLGAAKTLVTRVVPTSVCDDAAGTDDNRCAKLVPELRVSPIELNGGYSVPADISVSFSL